MATTTGPNEDPTFRKYEAHQAQAYAKGRGSYPDELYNTLLRHHEASGGQFEALLDVGCGPGNATRDLAINFDHAVGVDPGAEMINTARQLGGDAKTGPIRFRVAAAEECGNAVGPEGETFDLIASAMAVRGVEASRKLQTADHDTGSLVRHGSILAHGGFVAEAERHRGLVDMRFALLP